MANCFERFGEDVCHLFGAWNVRDFDLAFLDSLSDLEVFNFDMLSLFVVDWILNEGDAGEVVLLNDGGSSLGVAKVFKEGTEPKCL